MRDFGYSERGRAVNEAQAEVHAASKEVVDRNDASDPRTRRWLSAIEAFRAAYAGVYPATLREVDQGTKPASNIDAADMLDFLEADPIFDRSGYMKEKLLTELKRRELNKSDVERLQGIILSIIRKGDHRREFRRYCRAASAVDDQQFRSEVSALEKCDDPQTARRANWVLAALDGKWLHLKRAARGQERRGDT